MLKFFKKEEQSNSNSDLINVACLMIHAAKIDEHYTDKEKTIIKNIIKKLDNNNEDIDKLILEAEKKESTNNLKSVLIKSTAHSQQINLDNTRFFLMKLKKRKKEKLKKEAIN